VINAYWHQRFQQLSQSHTVLEFQGVINAYWHQRFQQNAIAPGHHSSKCDQRLLASKVSTVLDNFSHWRGLVDVINAYWHQRFQQLGELLYTNLLG